MCDVTVTNPVVESLELLKSSDAINVAFVEGNGTITITRATEANEGTYTCKANNGETRPTTFSFVLRMTMPRRATEPVTAPEPSPTDSAGELINALFDSQSFT